jgi:hypothetical protein
MTRTELLWYPKQMLRPSLKKFVKGSPPHLAFVIEASVSGTWLVFLILQYGKALTMKKRYGHQYLSTLEIL